MGNPFHPFLMTYKLCGGMEYTLLKGDGIYLKAYSAGAISLNCLYYESQ